MSTIQQCKGFTDLRHLPVEEGKKSLLWNGTAVVQEIYTSFPLVGKESKPV